MTDKNKTKTENLIEMKDGTLVDFGARSKLVLDIDWTQGVVTFAVSNGEKFIWEIPSYGEVLGMEVSLGQTNSILSRAYTLGLITKIRNSISVLKTPEAIFAQIVKQTTEIDNGKFNFGLKQEVTSLNLSRKVIFWAYAKYLQDTEAFASWQAVENMETISAEVVADILTKWEEAVAVRKVKILEDKANGVKHPTKPLAIGHPLLVNARIQLAKARGESLENEKSFLSL